MSAILERRKDAIKRQEFEDAYWDLLEARAIDWQEQDKQDEEKRLAQIAWIEMKNNYKKRHDGSN